MTIILALGNDDQLIQISDRRLSSNGRMLDDESNKVGVMTCINARVAFGYTGIARYHSFRTIDWLLTALSEAGPPDYLAHSILERLKENATHTFQEHPALRLAPRSVKKLSILFSGYIYGNGGPQLGYAVISNYTDLDTGHQFDTTQDNFTARFFSSIDVIANPTLIQRVGNWHGISEQNMYQLRQILNERKPRKAILDVAIDFLRELSDRPESANSIGKQLTSISINPNLHEPVCTDYHSNVVMRGSYMPASVVLLPHQSFTISNISISPVEDDTPPMSVPKVNKNAPCPCGSRVRYKNCHGKITINTK